MHAMMLIRLCVAPNHRYVDAVKFDNVKVIGQGRRATCALHVRRYNSLAVADRLMLALALQFLHNIRPSDPCE